MIKTLYARLRLKLCTVEYYPLWFPLPVVVKGKVQYKQTSNVTS